MFYFQAVVRKNIKKTEIVKLIFFFFTHSFFILAKRLTKT